MCTKSGFLFFFSFFFKGRANPDFGPTTGVEQMLFRIVSDFLPWVKANRNITTARYSYNRTSY